MKSTRINAERGRKFSPKKNEFRHRNREGSGKFFLEDDDKATRLTLDGFLTVKGKWHAAREKYRESKAEARDLLNQFPRWMKNVPNLLDTLEPLMQNEHFDDDDIQNEHFDNNTFFLILQKEELISPELAAIVESERKERERLAREEIAAQIRKERAEMLKEKILERVKETYYVRPGEIHITESPPHENPDIMQANKDMWGEEIPGWGRVHDTAITTRFIYTKAAIIGNEVYIMDIRKYGTGPSAMEEFIADHEEGKSVSLHLCERGKAMRKNDRHTAFEEDIATLIIYDPESHISGNRAV